jgi:hypothetical protein
VRGNRLEVCQHNRGSGAGSESKYKRHPRGFVDTVLTGGVATGYSRINMAIIAADASPAFINDYQGDTMRSTSIRKAGLYILIFNFLVTTFPQQALAGIIATPAAIAAQENHESLSRLKDLLAREDVRGQLVQMGIDPVVAEQRVNSLTPSEVAQLQPQLDNLPAGGDGLLVVIGVVFIVLIILELVGVTNIFSKF